jgi:hypothetical protein
MARKVKLSRFDHYINLQAILQDKVTPTTSNCENTSDSVMSSSASSYDEHTGSANPLVHRKLPMIIVMNAKATPTLATP